MNLMAKIRMPESTPIRKEEGGEEVFFTTVCPSVSGDFGGSSPEFKQRSTYTYVIMVGRD